MVDANQSPRRFRQVLDALVYAIAVAGFAFVVGVVVSFSLGSDLVGVKYFLFLIGFLLFGYATLLMLPSAPWDVNKTDDGGVEIVRNEERGEVIGSREETRFQATVQRIPPLSRYPIPPEERFPSSMKLFVASIAVLATSYIMETVFGVGL
ncbi:hypothetical protein SAMN05421858_2722 [Haladaptatus litoreus]|uniref:Uncharacterized protein n=1 Tax=Haladaptatus litoreus TaxID=553468 RepID=A0A1N7BRS9_9EURY|nr:hypothetical protein [Haladaptatus litoreus]SIR54089.1 hypothetical protein SAMN05421858_2722 [Haladaptatus litoreus]